jgi:hypothetical protein
MRLTLLLAVVLQALSCVGPANAFILCISNDGCIALERAAPGARRCAEEHCDRGHAAPDHDCRDIPIVIDAANAQSAPVERGAAVLPALMPARLAAAFEPAAAPPVAAAVAPQRAAPPRTVVLQL